MLRSYGASDLRPMQEDKVERERETERERSIISAKEFSTFMLVIRNVPLPTESRLVCKICTCVYFYTHLFMYSCVLTTAEKEF
jgi:hypothetical protein